MATLDIGRLLRWKAMMEAAQVEPTRVAARGLSFAYTSLADELKSGLLDAGRADLVAECERLFPPLHDPRLSATNMEMNSLAAQARAVECLVRLRQLTGWVQGLIDEQTLEMRLRLEAEEKAKLSTQPPTGFSA